MLDTGLHIIISEDRIKQIEESLRELKKLIATLNTESNSIGDWLTEEEVLRITKLGKTTLYNLRRAGQLTQSTISGKNVYYRKSELERILNTNEKRNYE